MPHWNDKLQLTPSMNQPAARISSQATEPGAPSARAKKIWTAVLAVHILAVLLSVFSLVVPDAPSILREDLGEYPITYYTSLLHMDSDYGFCLTGDRELDYEQIVEILFEEQEDTSDILAPIVLPDKKIVLGSRWRRYEALGNRIAEDVEFERDPILASYVVEGLMKQHGVETGIHRMNCFTHFPIMIDDFNFETAEEMIDAPNQFYQFYSAHLIPFQGSYMLSKVTEDFKNARARTNEEGERANSQ